MAKLTKDQVERANAVATANKAAATQIEMAGRGLYECMNACQAGTATLKTVQDLVAVAAYVNDAAMLLIENEQGAGAPPEKRLILTDSKG